jgi:transcriptional regulator with XRE-family HTH domain
MKNTNKISKIEKMRNNPKFSGYLRDANLRLKLGIEVYLARERKGLSQQQLAKNIGTTQRLISNIESGDINIGIELLNRIILNLGFDSQTVSKVFGLNFETYTAKYDYKIHSLYKIEDLVPGFESKESSDIQVSFIS